MILPSENITHWTVDENKREMQVSDDAFIARDLARFNHAPDVVVYYPGGVVMNLSAHLTDMRLTYSMFSDAKPHNHDYKVLFGDGDWTPRSQGSMMVLYPGQTASFLQPDERSSTTS